MHCLRIAKQRCFALVIPALGRWRFIFAIERVLGHPVQYETLPQKKRVLQLLVQRLGLHIVPSLGMMGYPEQTKL